MRRFLQDCCSITVKAMQGFCRIVARFRRYDVRAMYVLSRTSALEFWRSPESGRRHFDPLPTDKAGRAVLDDDALRAIHAEGLCAHCSTPVHLAVMEARLRKEVAGVVAHVRTAPVVPGSMLKVSSGIAVDSPASCFIQMASCWNLAQSIALGFEFCGNYSLPANGGDGFFKRPPLISSRQLSGQIERMSGFNGRPQAQRCARFVLDGSASPMETALVMLLCLPPLLGGYGLPWPQLNYRVNYSSIARPMVDKRWYECDEYWADAHVAIEYDSDEFHVGSERISEDSRRRNALASLGITVISITRKQIMDAMALDKAAHQVARLLGKRFQHGADCMTPQRRDLRRTLLMTTR